MPPKKRRGGRPKKKNNFATYNKARQDAKLADAKAAEAATDRCAVNPPLWAGSEMHQHILGLDTAPRPLRLMIWT